MSQLRDYLRKELQIKKLREELQLLEQDAGFKQELEFKRRLESLIAEFDKSAEEVIELLSPERVPAAREAGKPAAKAVGTRRKRRLKIYRNPHTQAVIETRGGNHRELKMWKEQYGSEQVESWLEGTEA